MQILFQILIVLHVLAAMLAFGTAVFLPRRVREMLGAERGEARRQLPGIMVQSKAIGGSGLFILLSGLLLASLWPLGLAGFHSPFMPTPVRFHIGLLLALIWWGTGAFVVRPTLVRIGAVVQSDAPIDPALPLMKRVGMLAGISHALFTVIVVLMLWRL
jgi:hypothetical protein